MKALPAFVGAPTVNSVYMCDCFTLMKALPDKSVDAYITDLPYGTTACKWDTIIPFAPMWAEVKRTLKPRGVFVTTASQPFTSALVMSNLEWFKYEWIYEKTMATDYLNGRNKPMKAHENVLVFSSGTTANGSTNRMPYYPQIDTTKPAWSKKQVSDSRNQNGAWARKGRTPFELNIIRGNEGRLPRSVFVFKNGNNNAEHPTQKPVALYEYLIRTYTQPNELVVDFCCGSGTTALAARNTGRNFIVGDVTPEYVDVAKRRLAMPYTPTLLEATA